MGLFFMNVLLLTTDNYQLAFIYIPSLKYGSDFSFYIVAVLKRFNDDGDRVAWVLATRPCCSDVMVVLCLPQ